jgi:hypothetical protein
LSFLPSCAQDRNAKPEILGVYELKMAKNPTADSFAPNVLSAMSFYPNKISSQEVFAFIINLTLSKEGNRAASRTR